MVTKPVSVTATVTYKKTTDVAERRNGHRSHNRATSYKKNPWLKLVAFYTVLTEYLLKKDEDLLAEQ